MHSLIGYSMDMEKTDYVKLSDRIDKSDKAGRTDKTGKIEISEAQLLRERERLLQRLEKLDIKPRLMPYPAARTVEEGKRLRGSEVTGIFTKNLLLKDRKENIYLVSLFEDREFKLGALHRRLGAHGRMSFTAGETMIDLLGVEPGSLTPLAVINDRQDLVRVVLDKLLLEAEEINYHPIINTERIKLTPEELLRFLRSCGHEPLIVDFEVEQE